FRVNAADKLRADEGDANRFHAEILAKLEKEMREQENCNQAAPEKDGKNPANLTVTERATRNFISGAARQQERLRTFSAIDDGIHVIHTEPLRLATEGADFVHGRFPKPAHFFGRPPHISSSANGWIGPCGFGLGSDFKTASARNKSLFVVIFTFVLVPSTT